jgi:hypothetical protein
VLDADEVAARLDAIRTSDWEEQTLRRAGKLGRRKYRPLVTAVLEPASLTDPAARRDQETRLVEAAASLDGLSPGELGDVMAILHPALGPTLARWWTDSIAQPYARGWLRRAFRAPRHPEVSRSARMGDLRRLIKQVGPFDRDPVWLAAWGTYLAPLARTEPAVGPLLAAAIDVGGRTGDRVLQTLFEVGNGEHSVGVMGRHVVTALLRANRPEGWEYVERLLLAAQGQEGLRQVILEAIDEARPPAFDRMLTLITEQNLVRFAATVRAAGVWLGLPGDVTEIPKVADRIGQLRRYRSDPDARRGALAAGDPWAAYVALCALAMADVHDALDSVEVVLRHPERDLRAAAVRFLAAVGLRSANIRLAAACADEDLVVAMLAATALDMNLAPVDTFDRLETLARRLPAQARQVDGVGVERGPVSLARAKLITQMFRALGSRPPSVMLPWIADMDANARWQYVSLLGKNPGQVTPELREVVITMVGDRSSHVREAAVKVAEKLGVTPADVAALEPLLTRGASDLRRAVIALLAKQGPTGALASVERLWASSETSQRDAAAELLASLGTSYPAARETAARMVASGVSERHRELLATLTGQAQVVGPGLGLYEPARRAPLRPVIRASRPFAGESARRIVSALDDLAEAHRDTRLTLTTWQGSREVLLADATRLPTPFLRSQRPLGDEDEEASGLVLAEVFRSWWADRPSELRSGPLDALHAYAAAGTATNPPRQPWEQTRAERNAWWANLQAAQVGGSVGVLRHPGVVGHVLSWLVLDDASPETVEECVSAVEDALAAVPDKLIDATPPAMTASRIMTDFARVNAEWRTVFADLSWLKVLGALFARRPELFSTGHIGRWFNVARLLDEPRPGSRRRPVPSGLLLAAHQAGVVTDDDVYDALFNTRLLAETTRRRRDTLELRDPGAVVLADRLRARVVEVERSRGELATPASRLAHQIASISGADLALELLARLGRAALLRGYISGNEGREAVYSHLLRVSYPGSTDTGARVAEIASHRRLRDEHLVELALFAPQWAAVVEEALAWEGLADAVWWFHAHTKDEQWSVSAEVREAWGAQTAERTELSASDRVAGAVDVAWFTRCHDALNLKQWKTVHSAAKLASGGNGHRRAQLFAEAMLGAVDEAALVTRISTKRHQDSVRALGLLPLPGERAEANKAVQRRYAVMREFERGSSKFGSQRQSSERTAVRIGVENLARSAGYTDPQRFVWATEAAESADLAAGPVSVTADDVGATLAVDEEGVATFSITRKGRALAAVPAPLRRHPGIVALRDRKTALVRQATRVRASLEAAMVRRERFSLTDLGELTAHPVVAPMLRLLVFINENGATMRPTGSAWASSSGELVTPGGELRLVHPVDLVGSGEWIAWQEQLFVGDRRQPFKQVFRELYVLTVAERATAPLSHRYEGHQVQPRQALALFGRRGWVHDREASDLSRVFHDYDLVARVTFLDGFGTPAEVELPTVQAVGFTRRSSYVAEALDIVPPVVFSETMRDLDLVVSVAHAGGVDPEASASTVEMRAALVREATRALKLGNVREVGSHVVIEGVLGDYSVHLGSGVVHRRPGGAVCIIPVNSQRRGRLFLPFADDDPKTAEVVSKVLLLANDRQIRDPTILEQLRG